MKTARELRDNALEHCILPLASREALGQHGLNIYVRGEGTRLWDTEGNEYLDMMSSHTRANSLGYGNEEVAHAVYEQLRQLHYVGTITNLAEPAVTLAVRLAALAPGDLDRCVFVSGGSEAVETAIKIAKQYHIARGEKSRAYKVISRWFAYHGATMGAVAASDWLDLRHIAEPGVPGYAFIPAPRSYRNAFSMNDDDYCDFCASYLEQQILHEGPDLIAAFIAEPIMQAHGVQIPQKRYWHRVREICDRYDVLLIVDEVITGFGRTGEWFAINHFDVEPDIMTMAKALTAGYVPMGAVITRSEIADAMPVFQHIHTFSGHAGAAAAANAVIEIKERDGLIERASENGSYFKAALCDGLQSLESVGEIRGCGMWHAIDFTGDRESRTPWPREAVRDVARRMYGYGVIVGSIGDAIEIAPPLITTRADLDRTVELAARAIGEVESEYR